MNSKHHECCSQPIFVLFSNIKYEKILLYHKSYALHHVMNKKIVTKLYILRDAINISPARNYYKV